MYIFKFPFQYTCISCVLVIITIGKFKTENTFTICHPVTILSVTVNVLKFHTLCSIPDWPKSCFFFVQLFYKILHEKVNSIDPDQTTPLGLLCLYMLFGV